MHRSTRRQRSRFANRVHPRLETLEARLLLTCAVNQRADGMLVIEGNEHAAHVVVEDRGNGNVSVSCQHRGLDLPIRFLVFEDATGLEADLGPGDDVFEYSSVQDVNVALPSVDVSMGDGNDVGAFIILLEGTLESERDFVFNLRGDAADDEIAFDMFLADGVPLRAASNDVDAKGGDDEIAFATNAQPDWDDGYWMLDFNGGLGSDKITTSLASTDQFRGNIDVEMHSGEDMQLAYTKPSRDSVVENDNLVVSVAQVDDASNREGASISLDVNSGGTTVNVSGDGILGVIDVAQAIAVKEDLTLNLKAFATTVGSTDSSEVFEGMTIFVETAVSDDETPGFFDGRLLSAQDLRVEVSGAHELDFSLDGPNGQEIDFLGEVIQQRQGSQTHLAFLRQSSHVEIGVNGFDHTGIVAQQIGDAGVETSARVSATNPTDRSSPILLNVLTQNENINNWEISVPEHESVFVDFKDASPQGVNAAIAIPNLLDARKSANESSSISTLNVSLHDGELNLAAADHPFEPGGDRSQTDQPTRELKLATSNDSGRSRGFGFVTMEIDAAAEGSAMMLDIVGADRIDAVGVEAPDGSTVLINMRGDAGAGDTGSLSLDSVELLGALDVNVRGFENFRRQISGMRIADGTGYREEIHAQKPLLIIAEDVEGEAFIVEPGGSFVSQIVGGPERNHIVNRLSKVTNRGEFRQTIDTGGGRDTVTESLDSFQNHGSAEFVTQLGKGSDFSTFRGHDIYVAPGASLVVRMDGNRGRDRIFANISATVDGDYNFIARGGRGADTIAIVHQVRNSPRARDESRSTDHPPAIDILIKGEGGNDWLGLWLLAPDVEDELLNALIDGGSGTDLCWGNVEAVNCEL